MGFVCRFGCRFVCRRAVAGFRSTGSRGSRAGKVLFGSRWECGRAEQHHRRGSGESVNPRVHLGWFITIRRVAAWEMWHYCFLVAAVAGSCQECQDHVERPRTLLRRGSVESGGVVPRCLVLRPKIHPSACSPNQLLSREGSQIRYRPCRNPHQSIARHVDPQRAILHPILVCSGFPLLSRRTHAHLLLARATKAASGTSFSVCCDSLLTSSPRQTNRVA